MGDTRKTAVRVEIKDADKGEVDLVFATFSAWDKDQDWTEPGAFTDGAKVPVSAYGHKSWEGALPVGIATLSQTQREAQASAKFFMDTPDGIATFKTVKRLHEEGLGDWSYGYRPKTWEMGERDGQRGRILKAVDVDEISPVLVGAGVGTRTLSAKAAGRHAPEGGLGGGERTYLGVLSAHETLTEDAAWRPSDAVKGLGLAPSIMDLRAVHAYVDPDSNPELKASYHFLHHADPGGPANVRACTLGIAVLNGAYGGVGIPDAAKAGVYAHLAGHLNDAGAYVPELRTKSGTLKTADAALVVLADLGSVIGRIAEVGASRALKGEKLTKAQKTILGWIEEDLVALRTLMATPQEDVEREYLRFIQLTRGV